MQPQAPKKGVLLVNLGSPDSPEIPDVKRYLDEFLMDERVIDFPYWFRVLLIRGIILNTRPKKSSAAYKSVWLPEGSPLIVTSRKVEEKVKALTQYPIALGMRYGNPSIESGIRELLTAHPSIEEIFMIPLYPHYAMSSYETVVVKAQDVIKQHFKGLKMTYMPPFYEETTYIKALSNSIAPYLQEDYDHILFSYHGIPERHVRKSDPTGSHCLKVKDCCNVANADAHAFCYAHQVKQTTYGIAAALNIPKEKYSVSFQSRIGGGWLKPYTDKQFEAFPQQGIKKLLVVCPAFVSDCLETIEEIGEEGKETFLHAGGIDFTLIPCLNESQEWIEVLNGYIEQHLG